MRRKDAVVMLSVFDPKPAANALLHAARHGERLVALPAQIRPGDLGQGYDVQDAVLNQSGGTRGGWKLGVGSPAQLRTNKLSRPLVGQLDGARLHANSATLRMPTDDEVVIECEIAFVLDRDIPPTPGRAPVASDIRHACVTFEVVRSRFVDRRAVGWPSFVADNVGFEALVVGDPFCHGLDIDAMQRVNDSVQVFLDDQPNAAALSGDAATDPLRSLGALYAHAAERGMTLKAGEIISTGAMCTPFNISGANHTLRAAYLGQAVNLTLLPVA